MSAAFLLGIALGAIGCFGWIL